MKTIVAQHHQFTVGVDTHARTQTFSVLADSGVRLGTKAFPSTPSGRSRAIGWAGRLTGGEAGVLWAIEGAGSYGAQRARAVTNTGYAVVEAPRVNAKPGTGWASWFDALRGLDSSPNRNIREIIASWGRRCPSSGCGVTNFQRMFRRRHAPVAIDLTVSVHGRPRICCDCRS